MHRGTIGLVQLILLAGGGILISDWELALGVILIIWANNLGLIGSNEQDEEL